MTSKPETASQEARSAAWDLAMVLLGPDTTSDHDLDLIARAIMASIAAERKAIAEMVEDYQPDLRPWETPSERINATTATDYACVDLAAAIRKRGEGA